jgi:LacI family transcriptional regulator
VGTLLRLSNGENLATKRVELSTHLVVRSSTAPRPELTPKEMNVQP